MMYTHPISKEAAEELFKKECFMVNGCNVVDEERAVMLLGEKAVQYGYGKLGVDSNIYGILLDGDKEPMQIEFLYKSGFMRACFYRNAELLRDRKRN